MDEWQVKQLNAISGLIKPEWHYADIGACRGEILQYLKKNMSFGHVFEPDPANYIFLHSNEGAEWDLFEGAQNILKIRDIVWQVEFHLDEDWPRREILFDNGYNIYDLNLNKLARDAKRLYQAILIKGSI